MVKESKVKMLLKRVDETELINGTILVTARIYYLEVPDEIIQEDGFLELHRAGTITSTGLDAYFNVDPLCRLSYAKVDMPLTEVPLNARQ